MTVQDIIDNVMRRLRECGAELGSQDEYALMIADFVWDAIQLVEKAYDWESLRAEGTYVLTSGVLSTTDANFQPKEVWLVDGTNTRKLPQMSRDYYMYKKADTSQGTPRYWMADQLDIRFYPQPPDGTTFVVDGLQRMSDFTGSYDSALVEVTVPTLPVIYYALASSSRERGDMGGQNSAEWLAMADRYLSDAIANEASRHFEDTLWRTV